MPKYPMNAAIRIYGKVAKLHPKRRTENSSCYLLPSGPCALWRVIRFLLACSIKARRSIWERNSFIKPCYASTHYCSVCYWISRAGIFWGIPGFVNLLKIQ